MFDATILARDALRVLDSWCSMAQNCLLRIGETIRPMRAQANDVENSLSLRRPRLVPGRRHDGIVVI